VNASVVDVKRAGERRAAGLPRVAGAVALLAVVLLALSAGQASAASRRTTTLIVLTHPHVKGVRVSLDGRRFLTNAKGFVVINTPSGYHRIGIALPRRLPRGVRLRFAGWLDHSLLTHRVVQLHPGSDREDAGFIAMYPVTVRVVDQAGMDVPASRISRITLGNTLGARFTFPPGQEPPFLASNRIIRDHSGLMSVPIRYSARELMIDGTNAVNEGEQSFYVGSSPNIWKIKALLFPLTIRVRDALFGFGAGGSVQLTLPNGTRRVIGLGSGHSTTVVSLPRGTYELVAKGSGMGLSSPLALSKPQAAKLLMLSWVDFAAVLAFAALFVVGLPTLGRRISRRPGERQDLTPPSSGTEGPVSRGPELSPSLLSMAPDGQPGTVPSALLRSNPFVPRFLQAPTIHLNPSLPGSGRRSHPHPGPPTPGLLPMPAVHHGLTPHTSPSGPSRPSESSPPPLLAAPELHFDPVVEHPVTERPGERP
jgi:hypothetical protein